MEPANFITFSGFDYFDAADIGEGGALAQAGFEVFERCYRPDGVRFDAAVGAISNPTGEAEGPSLLLGEVPISD